MTLTAPTQIVFIIAVVIAIIGLLAALTTYVAFIPLSAFWIMTIAFVVLALGVLLKGM
jgi:hypothetical protein